MRAFFVEKDGLMGMSASVKFDEYGPERVFEVYNPKTGLHGFAVLDNLALGVAKGGIRMTPTVSVVEVSRLARAMTWKNSMADLPFGGGKAGIIADPKNISLEKKRALIEEFSRALKPVIPSLYVAGPDINTTEVEMGWFAKANGDLKACTGKPKELGGIPHELGSTGFGVYHSTLVAAEWLGGGVAGKTFAVEGFGNVGWFVSRFLTEKGAKFVAVSDSGGVLHNAQGINFQKLAEVKKNQKTVTAYGEGSQVLKGKDDILGIEADILITAAVPDLITKENWQKIKAKLIVQGSNIPTTPAIEKELHKKGVLVIPDFVANAGGVISSWVEYKGGTPEEMFKVVEEKVKRNTKAVLEKTTLGKGRIPREIAVGIARQRVLEKMK